MLRETGCDSLISETWWALPLPISSINQSKIIARSLICNLPQLGAGQSEPFCRAILNRISRQNASQGQTHIGNLQVLPGYVIACKWHVSAIVMRTLVSISCKVPEVSKQTPRSYALWVNLSAVTLFQLEHDHIASA